MTTERTHKVMNQIDNLIDDLFSKPRRSDITINKQIDDHFQKMMDLVMKPKLVQIPSGEWVISDPEKRPTCPNCLQPCGLNGLCSMCKCRGV